MPKFSVKRPVRAAVDYIEHAEEELEIIRQHYDFEWGQDHTCDLDCTLSSAINKLVEARRELDALLARFRGKAIPKRFPRTSRV